MIVSCPHCGFSRTVAEGQIPARASRVTCPRCKGIFPFLHPDSDADFDWCPLPGSDSAWITPPSAADAPKAGFWIRGMAALVDSVLVAMVQLVMGLVLALVVSGLGSQAEETHLMLGSVTWMFSSVIAVAYYIFFTGYCGQTPGKMAVRIKVIRTDGSDISYGRACLRETLGKFLSWIILGAGYLMIAFSAHKQGLHDKIADTYVIKL